MDGPHANARLNVVPPSEAIVGRMSYELQQNPEEVPEIPTPPEVLNIAEDESEFVEELDLPETDSAALSVIVQECGGSLDEWERGDFYAERVGKLSAGEMFGNSGEVIGANFEGEYAEQHQLMLTHLQERPRDGFLMSLDVEETDDTVLFHATAAVVDSEGWITYAHYVRREEKDLSSIPLVEDVFVPTSVTEQEELPTMAEEKIGTAVDEAFDTLERPAIAQNFAQEEVREEFTEIKESEGRVIVSVPVEAAGAMQEAVAVETLTKDIDEEPAGPAIEPVAEVLQVAEMAEATTPPEQPAEVAPEVTTDPKEMDTIAVEVDTKVVANEILPMETSRTDAPKDVDNVQLESILAELSIAPQKVDEVVEQPATPVVQEVAREDVVIVSDNKAVRVENKTSEPVVDTESFFVEIPTEQKIDVAKEVEKSPDLHVEAAPVSDEKIIVIEPTREVVQEESAEVPTQQVLNETVEIEAPMRNEEEKTPIAYTQEEMGAVLSELFAQELFTTPVRERSSVEAAADSIAIAPETRIPETRASSEVFSYVAMRGRQLVQQASVSTDRADNDNFVRARNGIRMRRAVTP